jgi:hypothetical protein
MVLVADCGPKGNTQPPRLPDDTLSVYLTGIAFFRLNGGLHTTDGSASAVFTARRTAA